MGSYVLKTAKNGQFMFNLKAANGQVILTSEMYTTKAAAENGGPEPQAPTLAFPRQARKESAGG